MSADEALAKSGVLGIKVGRRVVTPKRVFTLWLYGEDFHMNENLADELEGLHPIQRSAYEFSYLSTARTLAHYYWQFANLPDAIRREPRLVP